MDTLVVLGNSFSPYAWPLVVIIIFLTIRKPFTALVTKIIEVRLGNIRCRFKQDQDIEPIHAQQDAPDGEIKDKSTENEIKNRIIAPINRFFDIQIINALNSAPHMAVILIWSQVEVSIRRRVSNINYSKEKYPKRNLSTYIKILSECTNIQKISMEIIEDMLDEKWEVVEGNLSVSKEDAKRYHIIGKKMILDIRAAEEF